MWYIQFSFRRLNEPNVLDDISSTFVVCNVRKKKVILPYIHRDIINVKKVNNKYFEYKTWLKIL